MFTNARNVMFYSLFRRVLKNTTFCNVLFAEQTKRCMKYQPGNCKVSSFVVPEGQTNIYEFLG